MSLASVRAENPTAAWSISKTLPLEGGLVDNPHDPGGVTDCGVSLRWALAQVAVDPADRPLFDLDHDGDVDAADIRGMTPDEAADIYYECVWKPGWYGRMTPALVAWKCFDIAVNTGPKRAGLLLQTALVDCGSGVVVDGLPGGLTATAVAAQAARDQGLTLMGWLRREQATFYRGLAASKPELATFLPGWLNRAAA